MSNEQQANHKQEKENPGHGPKYTVNIEGTDFPWPKETITTEEIITLAGFKLSEGVIEVNLEDQTETNLQPNQVIILKPGFGFSKKVKFKRGNQ